MAKRKVYRDKPSISKEEAEKLKDYSFLSEPPRSIHSPFWVIRNIMKNPKLMRKIILILIILITVLLTLYPDK